MKKSNLPLILSIISFILVFDLFYTLTPYPIKITADDVTIFSPSCYAASGDEPHKLVAKLSYWNGYEVIEYWYYWPYDGNQPVDDWEPVILLIKNNTVEAVAVRIHYNWRVSYSFPLEGVKPIVSFSQLYHTPLLTKLEGYERVLIYPTSGPIPEDVNYWWVFGLSLPVYSAITNALFYGLISAAVVFLISRKIA
ncbi:hypothetical protein DRP07_00220 [Archaeoglobales archaeon]|nr:MAG: hypothetical protein DRP07_00220 [Archaeoglobales archaeon]